MSTKEHWDAIFDKGQKFTTLKDEDLDAVLERVGNAKTALDVACGTGGLLVQLAQRGLVVTGMDVSSVALSKAHEALRSAGVDAMLIEADFNTPDFTHKITEPYDIVFIRLAFAFVQDRDVFLEAIKKCMVPEGAFICSSPGLLPGVEYDVRQNNISLLKDELEQTLHRHFKSVELIPGDISAGPNWPILTYLCR